jgi:hypothetical protein
MYIFHVASSYSQTGIYPGSGFLRDNIEERAREIGMYIIEQEATVRAAAAKFGVSKSTVHTEVIKRNG